MDIVRRPPYAAVYSQSQLTRIMEERMSDTDATPSPVEARQPVNGAQAIAQSLVDHGVDRVFFMTGGDFGLWRALDNAGIELCLVRSEAASVVMADAYARMTGRASVVYGQWGPGAANVAGALADAWWAGSPVLALTSTVPTTSEYKFEYQELDQQPMFAPVTKWQARVNRGDRAAELVTQALRIAESGAPGPVHLDVPSDIIRDPIGVEDVPRAAPAPVITRPAPSDDAVADVLARLRAAERPVVLAGGGVLASGAADELVALAEAARLPVATTMGGKGSIPEHHELALGVAGRYSRLVSNEILREADLTLAIGTDLGGLATDGYRLPDPASSIVQVDLEPARLGRTMDVDVALAVDAGAFCRALADQARESGVTASPAWVADVSDRRDAWRRRFDEIAAEPADGHVRPEAISAVLREIAADDDVVVADTGFTGAWAGTLFPVRTAGRTFIRAAGTLGWAFPAVLGAQLARPGARAFALIGDGGVGYNIGDIESAVRLRIPAITIIMNNACLAYEYVSFEMAERIGWGHIVDEVCDFDDVDFAAVARAFGAFGVRVTSADELRTALKEAVAQDKPAVIDVVVSKTRFAPVTSYDFIVQRDL